jgi:hypothetical protein
VRHFRRLWDEPRDDEHAAWGACTYYYETDDELWVVRALEHYAAGPALAYDLTLVGDRFGGLPELPIDEEDVAGFAITAAEFDAAWTARAPHNRRAPDDRLPPASAQPLDPAGPYACSACDAELGALVAHCPGCGARLGSAS